MGYFANGAEGGGYQNRYCFQCIHWKDEGPDCAVWMAHLEKNYEECNNAGSILDILIPRGEDGMNEQCRMFVQVNVETKEVA